jgi:hypothetical protein
VDFYSAKEKRPKIALAAEMQCKEVEHTVVIKLMEEELAAETQQRMRNMRR